MTRLADNLIKTLEMTLKNERDLSYQFAREIHRLEAENKVMFDYLKGSCPPLKSGSCEYVKGANYCEKCWKNWIRERIEEDEMGK